MESDISDQRGSLTAALTDPYGTFEALRKAGPVHRVTGADGLPIWLVTRYEDVRQALADPRLSMDKKHARPGNYRGFALPPALDANLLNMDPPDHTRVRRLVSRSFTLRRITQLREPVQRTADDLLDAIAPHGRADLITSYAAPLPTTVICDLLGVPADDRPDFRSWTDALMSPDPARPELARQAVGSLQSFFVQLIRHKRVNPADDLLSDLVTVRDAEDRLTEDELTSLAFLLLFAGYENTVHLIGNSVLALLTHRDQLDALRRDLGRLPDAIEEFARYDGPMLLAQRRFAIEDLAIAGVTIPAGETVVVSLASANRDPERFSAPDTLDLSRQDTGHLALGYGIHYCVGAPLARMETEIALETLLRRFPDLALDVPQTELRWRPSMRARGVLGLPVRY